MKNWLLICSLVVHMSPLWWGLHLPTFWCPRYLWILRMGPPWPRKQWNCLFIICISTPKILIRLLPCLTCLIFEARLPGPPNSQKKVMFSYCGKYEKLVIHCYPCSTYVSSVMRSSSHFGTPGFNIRFPRTSTTNACFGFWLKVLIIWLTYCTCCWDYNFGVKSILNYSWGIEAFI